MDFTQVPLYSFPAVVCRKSGSPMVVQSPQPLLGPEWVSLLHHFAKEGPCAARVRLGKKRRVGCHHCLALALQLALQWLRDTALEMEHPREKRNFPF